MSPPPPAASADLPALCLQALDEGPADDVQTVSGTTSRVELVVVAGPVASCAPVVVALLEVG